MALMRSFRNLADSDTLNILLVESEEQFQQRLAEALVEETDVIVNVKLAKTLPLPVENHHVRMDLVVFIINLTSELSFQSAEASLKYLEPEYFVGNVCIMVTNARNALVPSEWLYAVRKLAASLQCPLLYAEDQTPDGVTNAAARLLTILKVVAGFIPMTTAVYMPNLTRCLVLPDLDQLCFD